MLKVARSVPFLYLFSIHLTILNLLSILNFLKFLKDEIVTIQKVKALKNCINVNIFKYSFKIVKMKNSKFLKLL